MPSSAVGDGVSGLVGADEEAVDLAAVVAGRAGVADDGHLDVLGGHLGVQRLGDQVLVDHRDDRDVDTRHGAELGGVVAGGVDDVVAGDLFLPLSVMTFQRPSGSWVDVGDKRVAGDLRAELAGADGHGVGGAGGVGPAVVGRVEAEDYVVGGAP